ncbi:cysteine desulfurase family protein [Shewanella oncorhynchi]|uniref:cysteine desulfurase family protein n=1 Tax=Shewanella oncorhynchi TaxID=2726434 RepID=UPI003D7AEDD7
MIYLDTAASYPILPEVKLKLMDAFEHCYANSASSHQLGVTVQDKIDQVRGQIADSIGAYPSEIIFTSGATESNNIAFKSVLLGSSVQKGKKHIITSAIEHKCIFAICDYFKELGYDITFLKPDVQGMISARQVFDAITEFTVLVSIMHVNNELGTINPIEDIGQVCVDNEVLFHTDCAQSFGKLPINVDDANIDIMSISGHKIGGPKGIGAVYIRDLRHRNLLPVIHGAGQEQGIRGGTIAAPLILGLGSALEQFPRYYADFKNKKIKSYLLSKLIENSISYVVNGSLQALPHCVSLTLKNTNVPLMIRDNQTRLSLAQGSACSSKEIEASHVLSALGISREDAENTLRISFMLDATQEQIDVLVEAIKKATL